MKFRVSYTIDSGSTTEEEIREYAEQYLDGTDVEVVELKPEFEEGWYQYIGEAAGDHEEVSYWTLDELQYFGEDFTDNKYRRMNPPTPYGEEKYKDGYYLMSDGFRYRRVNGEWELFLPRAADWVMSAYDDSDIESEESVTWEHEL